MSELSDTDKSADPEVSSCAKAPADGSESADESAGEVGSSSETEMAATVEAILFSTDAPITAAKILQVAELPTKRAVTAAIENLNARYEASGASFRIENIAGGYRFQTLEAYHDVLSRLFKAKSESKLSQPAMETLSIVAYRQPVLRADIESIRGVACGEVLRGLMEKLLIKIVGRAEVIGRPMLYGTTRRFLEVFGLANLSDLPRADELRQPPQKTQTPPPVEATETADDAPDEAAEAETDAKPQADETAETAAE